MRKIRAILNSFGFRLTFVLIISLVFMVSLANFLMYEYLLRLKSNDLKNNLLTIAKTASLAVDPESLLKIPLDREGVNTPEYKSISAVLNKIKKLNPELKYIYTVTKTDKPGIWQFIVDPNPVARGSHGVITAYPGEKYNAGRFPEMLAAYQGPSVDKALTTDEWGVTLSGYAPILDKDGKAVAVLGVDINAEEIYAVQRQMRIRTILLLFAGIFISLLVGVFVSRRVTRPIKKLIEGTRKISAGDLRHKVIVHGKDEIAELAASFNNMAANLAESVRRLNDYFYGVVKSLVRSLEAKDFYTKGHSERVSEYAYKIAIEMGIPQERAELLREVAQLHDIGKLGIHEDILNKKMPLSDGEWDQIHKHPEVGEEILRPVFLDEEMLTVVRSHHERFDGSGYPDGLKGNQISIFAQITSVADAYDAMTSSRAYRSALSQEEAIKRLKDVSSTQFSP